MSTIWQRLGAFVATGENLTDDRISAFATAGGSWLCPVVYGDDASGPWNLAHLDDLARRAASFKTVGTKRGVQVGAWCNCFGGDPQTDARRIAQIVTDHRLRLCILDLEAAYQYPQGNADLMPQLVAAVRHLLPTVNLAVSTNGLNNSMIWNGRTLTPPRSFFDLGVRILPQWYEWMAAVDPSTRPDVNMKWLKEHGASDGNFADKTAPNGRGCSLSYVHGTLESTGLEGSHLDRELDYLHAARAFGLTPGWSIYTLENATEADLTLMAFERGKSFLV